MRVCCKIRHYFSASLSPPFPSSLFPLLHVLSLFLSRLSLSLPSSSLFLLVHMHSYYFLPSFSLPSSLPPCLACHAQHTKLEYHGHHNHDREADAVLKQRHQRRRREVHGLSTSPDTWLHICAWLATLRCDRQMQHSIRPILVVKFVASRLSEHNQIHTCTSHSAAEPATSTSSSAHQTGRTDIFLISREREQRTRMNNHPGAMHASTWRETYPGIEELNFDTELQNETIQQPLQRIVFT